VKKLNILVTNDDGIDSVGLHVLARAMQSIGDVTIVAPDSEYSGAGASIGALHLMEPVITEVAVEGIDTAWTVSGPPALCVFYARMGAFNFEPDLIVSGINPGANLGRAVYHSGTIGAALTGRNGGIPGIAVSQSFADPLEDTDESRQDYDERVSRQLWDPAAEIAVEVVKGMIDTEFADVGVLNLNVPNLPVDQIKGWDWTEVGRTPPWAMTEATLVPRDDAPGTYRLETSWGSANEQPPGTDSAAILDGRISVTVLSRIAALDAETPHIDTRLDQMLGR
jgi:5'-nucleotidase